MRKVLLVLIVLILMSFTGGGVKIAGDEKTAEDFVKSQGYTITSRKGEVNKYTLEKSKLYGGTSTIPYQEEWSVQDVKPDDYFGKQIIIYGFTVKNHPLEKTYHVKANVYIMLSDSKVIGGYSVPDNDSVGGCYSLEGKTLEEVTGLSYKEWCNDWKKRYEN